MSFIFILFLWSQLLEFEPKMSPNAKYFGNWQFLSDLAHEAPNIPVVVANITVVSTEQKWGPLCSTQWSHPSVNFSQQTSRWLSTGSTTQHETDIVSLYWMDTTDLLILIFHKKSLIIQNFWFFSLNVFLEFQVIGTHFTNLNESVNVVVWRQDANILILTYREVFAEQQTYDVFCC